LTSILQVVSPSPWCGAFSPLPAFKENLEINTGVKQGYSDTYPNILLSSSSSWFGDVNEPETQHLPSW